MISISDLKPNHLFSVSDIDALRYLSVRFPVDVIIDKNTQRIVLKYAARQSYGNNLRYSYLFYLDSIIDEYDRVVVNLEKYHVVISLTQSNIEQDLCVFNYLELSDSKINDLKDIYL
jgi:hypothetical protein